MQVKSQHTENEEKSCVSTVNDFVVLKFDEVGVFLLSYDNYLVYLDLHLNPLSVDWWSHVPLAKPSLTLLVHQQKESDHFRILQISTRVILA